MGVFLKFYNLIERDCRRLDYLCSHLNENSNDVIDKVIQLEDYIYSLEEAMSICRNTYNWQLGNDGEYERIKQLFISHVSRVEERIKEKVGI